MLTNCEPDLWCFTQDVGTGHGCGSVLSVVPSMDQMQPARPKVIQCRAPGFQEACCRNTSANSFSQEGKLSHLFLYFLFPHFVIPNLSIC